MNFKRLLLALPLLFSARHNRDETDENSPYFVVPVGSRLVLHQTVTVPAFAAAVYLQGGLWILQTDISRYNPHCKFELRQPQDTPQTVTPDEFVVTRTTEEVEVMSETTQIRSRVLLLQSERQPQVSRLSCTVWQSIVEGRPVSGRELRQALGQTFTLEITGRAAASPRRP